jgi:cell division protein FtsN
MRNLSLILVIFFSLFIIACGNKKENTEELEIADNEIIEGTVDDDTSNANNAIISDNFTDESGIIDSSKKEQIVYTDASKEMQVDPPVNDKAVTEPIKEKPIVEVKNIEKKNIEKPVVKAHETKFYIVAGSFKKYSNAQNLFDLFKNKGYAPLILPKSDGYNRVAIVSYMQENEARKALTHLRSAHNDITFWLFKW